MVILGVDPGVRVAGYAIVSCEQRRCVVQTYGAIQLSQRHKLSSRIGKLYDVLSEIVTKWGVTQIALETPFLGKNTQNFLKLGYVRGILYLIASQYGTTLSESSPREVKQSITGSGGARKEQVARMVYQLCPGVAQVSHDDVTDALAIALGACFVYV